ncbi:16S rRNA (uracil(1498)-N(3))-methyltransferase [Weissella diestrammenae]|uniref:Ribosomal RNA small subunit methyltransferase E n=1 Tax=Weissella diestrammenae TaxID=1162633 RepID=A0A7G9T642_9LACO|nr:16S rRNA (uracil(1498)-N(3))-methyltransferase [Weissella diestrammenae]MCM0582405.1 16S rRNA (uracil(1498)-N(3))-methyltransferase [Weissella diestrammenae]QNN75567.1 16S rRNA (uracil(1498)-N(3))-methyltransferase [Weissella diestrammenae]
MQRYFLKQTPKANTFQLDQETQHHLMTVLRGKIGTRAEFVYPDHSVHVAEVVKISAEAIDMLVIEDQSKQVELPVRATLVLGLAKGDKPELVVQKGTELGAANFIFVETDWSVVHWGMKVERKIERLQKIAQNAAEQSHRLIIPTVGYVKQLSDLSQALLQNATKVVAWEESAKMGETQQLVKSISDAKISGEIVFLIGPEGGLTPDELTELERQNFVAAGFGPRILRAETAPLYALSALSYSLELE